MVVLGENGGQILRGYRKILAGLVVTTTLFAASVGSIDQPQAALSTTQQDVLKARRAQLVAQLNAQLALEHNAKSGLAGAESQYYSAQVGVDQVRAQLKATNARLAHLQQSIATEQKRDLDAQRQLAILTRSTYEEADTRSTLAALLSSADFGDAMARLKSSDSVSSAVAELQSQLDADLADVAKQRLALQQEFAQASVLERQLSDQSNRFMAAVAQRNMDLNSASAPVRALEAQIANIDNQLAGDPPPVNTGASCGNRFAYGQCTYYVATRRCIPWSGNANQWYVNAARMGYAEGHQPAVGAVVVFWPGGDGASGVGHVGYVEVVGPAGGVPAGYFRLSEMNFGGWGHINYRNLPNNSSGIQGFIYGKA